MTVIVTFNGRYWTLSGNIGQFWAISNVIGRYWEISSDIKVIFSSVKSVTFWVRSKSSRTGSVNHKPIVVRPCRIRTVMMLLKITDIGQNRCIAIYITQFCITPSLWLKIKRQDKAKVKKHMLICNKGGKYLTPKGTLPVMNIYIEVYFQHHHQYPKILASCVAL